MYQILLKCIHLTRCYLCIGSYNQVEPVRTLEGSFFYFFSINDVMSVDAQAWHLKICRLTTRKTEIEA